MNRIVSVYTDNYLSLSSDTFEDIFKKIDQNMTSSTSWQNQLQTNVRQLPELLQHDVSNQLEDFINTVKNADLPGLKNPDVLATLCQVWACSRFIAINCIKCPSLIHQIEQLKFNGGLGDSHKYQEILSSALHNTQDLTEFSARLRQFRQQFMSIIAWWDIAGWSTLEDTMRHLSALADAAIKLCVNKISQDMQATFGCPQDDAQNPQSFVVIAMGKLGANELNFSSDVDLIFTYPRDGQTSNTNQFLSNGEYFSRLGQRLISMLSDNTADGFVFRVDVRLRPFGDSGPLVMSFDALEHYYLVHGRSWERYAMIKARVLTGSDEEKASLKDTLEPFIYRRYLDYGAFDSLRNMKQKIVSQVNKKGMENNVKLGWGGIREIEFIGQAYQIIRGGQETDLQIQQTIAVIKLLGQKDHLPEYAVTQLIVAYKFLRQTEHRLQEYADQQTHELPTDTLTRLRLAIAMGYPHWEALNTDLNHHRTKVQNIFEQVFEAPQVTQPDNTDFSNIWHTLQDESHAILALANAGYESPKDVLSVLKGLRKSAKYRTLTSQAQRRYDQLMPMVLGATLKASHPDVTFTRIIELIGAIGKRSSYLALLTENPMVLSQLVKLCDASAWISRQLTLQPFLLDELIDPRSLYHPPSRAELESQLQQRLDVWSSQDLERQMETLRHFKNASVLRVAAADITGNLPLMEVSNFLTDIAELVLQAVLEIAWNHLVHRHGTPNTGEVSADAKGFAIIAFGKLGGLELGYGSDLDLVFLYEAKKNGHTVGGKSIPNEVFYTRLGQRIIHILTAFTPAGTLYDIDMRLRPSGKSGLLVTHIERFSDYQEQQAWTWEHQALVRARSVAGDPVIGDEFFRIRQRVLMQKCDVDQLVVEVREMRERMRQELLIKNKQVFDIKQGAGGLADIEFMLQYLVLRYASEYPSLIEFSDKMRILQAMQREKILEKQSVTSLSDIYLKYRSIIHKKSLQGEKALVASDELMSEQEAVKASWQSLMSV